VAPSPAGTIAHPTDLHAAPIAWRDAMVPGSVAGSLASGRCDDLGAVDAWDTDWWFHTTLTLTAAGDGHLLRFDGLATLATVWIDGVEVARHHTAMRSLDIALDGLSPGAHELTIVCRGLSAFEPPARPRQRWKTRLVPDARLRWLRTPLFGHMPGWTPPWPVIGPYRDVHVLAPDDDALLAAGVQWTTDDDGVISWTVDVAAGAGVASLRIGEVDTPLTAHDGRITGSGTADLPRWWPHTHGTPTLHEMSLQLDDRVVPGARVGARTISADRTDGAFALHVNGVAVFARGAVWTPLDAARAWNDPAALRIALEQVRDAGCNLLRLPGIGLPEQPEFHALCDELGVMVWFDLPYANFDHPFDDAAFGADARIEAAEQLRALAGDRFGGRRSGR
jgi:beta-mannosidase